MKICFITNQIITENASMKRALFMANPLYLLGHEVIIYAQDDDNNKKVIETLEGVKAFYFQPASAIQERNQKQAFLKENNFDVIHICGLGVRNAIFPKYLENSVVIMDHSELESSFKEVIFTRRIFQNFLEWWSLLTYDASILASKYLEFLFRRRLHRLNLQRSLLYLPYAHDPATSPLLNWNISSLRNKYYNRKIVVYIGKLYKKYGCFEMLEAFRMMAEENIDFVALIIGNGSEKNKAIDFVKQHKLERFVEFKGYVPEEEIPLFLYSADVLLSPLNDTVADWARCPSKLFMYMTTKKPIVTCAIGEAYEHLKNDGFYYQPNSIDSMVCAIQQAINQSDTWIPNYNPIHHTWHQRVNTWLNWVYSVKPDLMKKI